MDAGADSDVFDMDDSDSDVAPVPTKSKSKARGSTKAGGGKGRTLTKRGNAAAGGKGKGKGAKATAAATTPAKSKVCEVDTMKRFVAGSICGRAKSSFVGGGLQSDCPKKGLKSKKYRFVAGKSVLVGFSGGAWRASICERVRTCCSPRVGCVYC